MEGLSIYPNFSVNTLLFAPQVSTLEDLGVGGVICGSGVVLSSSCCPWTWGTGRRGLRATHMVRHWSRLLGGQPWGEASGRVGSWE